MIRNTAFAEAFVSAAAKAINANAPFGVRPPWPALQVVDRVTYTKIGTVREQRPARRISVEVK